jgi:beta-lactam-binding protein with PASTA domain
MFTKQDSFMDKVREYSHKYGKVFLFCGVVFFVFSGLVATAVFFISLRGAEQVLVPDVTGKELTIALLELQTKELYPRIQLRFSGDAAEKGLILEQDPGFGTIVKAGRRIRLVVSQGIRLTAVDNYKGRLLNEVRMEIAQAVAAEDQSGQLLSLKEPVLYKVSDEPAGTVLEQSPAAGTAITGPVQVTLTVSRGPSAGVKEIPPLTGLSVTAAASRLAEREINFVFVTATAAEEQPFTVISQDMKAGAQITPDRAVRLQVALPARWATGETCALFSYDIPQTPVSIAYTLTAISARGERTALITSVLSGGSFTYPYLLSSGTTLSLGVQGRELHREVVR